VVTAGKIVTEHSEIIERDVGKLRAAGHLAERPNAGRSRLKPLIDLYVSTICQLDTCQFQSNAFRVRNAARCNEKMTALQCLIDAVLRDRDFNSLARLSRYDLEPRIQNDVDTFVLEETDSSSRCSNRLLRSITDTLLPKRRIA
jgi:hypothetical protein